MKNFFSSNLKYLREQKKWSKSKLGELVGVNQTTIGRWENEIITPSIDNVIDVLLAFNIPVSEIGTFLSTDLKNGNAQISTENDYKRILKDKGLMDDNEVINEENLDKLMKIADMVENLTTKKED